MKPQVLPGKGGGGWRVAGLGTLWGHRGLSRANGRETRLDPYLPTFFLFCLLLIAYCLFFSQLFSQHDFFVVDFCSHVLSLQSPPHATHEKSKISTVHSERRISCYRIITTFGFF